MQNLRIERKEVFDTSHMGWHIAGNKEEFDFCVRLLGAAKGKLAIFDKPKTTTVSIKVTGDKEEVRKLFESVEFQQEDFFYSVSVPYVDTIDFAKRVEAIWRQKDK